MYSTIETEYFSWPSEVNELNGNNNWEANKIDLKKDSKWVCNSPLMNLKWHVIGLGQKIDAKWIIWCSFQKRYSVKNLCLPHNIIDTILRCLYLPEMNSHQAKWMTFPLLGCSMDKKRIKKERIYLTSLHCIMQYFPKLLSYCLMVEFPGPKTLHFLKDLRHLNIWPHFLSWFRVKNGKKLCRK